MKIFKNLVSLSTYIFPSKKLSNAVFFQKIEWTGGTKIKGRQRKISSKQRTADAGWGRTFVDGMGWFQWWRSILRQH